MLLEGSVDLFDLLPAPVLLVELGSGRILFANAAAQALAGGEYPPGLAERVARGERFSGETIDWEARSLVVNGGTVVMPDGEAVGMVTVEDVTEIEGARRRSAVLAAASAALAESLDLEQTLRTVQSLAVPRFADRCVVELERADGEPVQTADELIVPLRARGTVIGALHLVMDASGRRFGEADLQAAQQLANRCALAIDNARLVGALRARTEEQRAILEGVADSVTAQSPEGRLVYANEAAFRLLGFESAEALLAAPIAEIMSATTCSRRRASRSRSTGCPAGARWPASCPSPRSSASARGARRGEPLVAHQGPPRPRRGGQAAPRHQPDRGHHRAQGGRAGPALPRRGQPGPGGLARLRADAQDRRPARRAGDRRLVRDRPLRRRRRGPPGRGGARRPREGGAGRAAAARVPADPEASAVHR
jgi:PAS domain-containing protein